MGSPIKYKDYVLKGGTETKYHQIEFVPADPALRGLRWEDGQVVEIGPLLCWRLSTTFVPDGDELTSAYPITHDGAVDGTYVLYPDGTVRYFDETFASIDEWVASEKKWEELKAQSEALRAGEKAEALAPAVDLQGTIGGTVKPYP